MKKALFLSLLLVVLAACSNQILSNKNQAEVPNSGGENIVLAKEENTQGKKVNEFILTAERNEWELSSNKTITAWTFNGTVPGEQIRVKEGEAVKITLKNKLEDPVSIHWHGVPVSNTEDGIPGVTQDAVLPGKEYTYEFVADTPGTYWYHSHQDGVNQLDKGLYGTFIVESKDDEQYDRDYTLVLDEWESVEKKESGMDGMNHSNMSMDMHHERNLDGMNHSNMDKSNDTSNEKKSRSMMEMGHDMSSYNIFTINGKTYETNKPLTVKKGELVKLRFVNAGYVSHKIHIPVNFKITHVDGQPINSPTEEKNKLLEIAPGERYDVSFIATDEDFTIDCHGDMEAAKDMKLNIQDESSQNRKVEHVSPVGTVKLGMLGKNKSASFSLGDTFDIEYTMELGTAMNSGEMVYTINGKTYPDVPPLKVNKGDKVKVTLKNISMDNADHPMHLHGHFFQILSKDGKPIEGSPIIKDTLNVKPGETYTVAFVADNPGNWLFHCHDLHHASTGMVTMVKYNNFKEFYKDEGNVNNKPE